MGLVFSAWRLRIVTFVVAVVGRVMDTSQSNPFVHDLVSRSSSDISTDTVTNHSEANLQALNALRQERVLCDCELVSCDGVKFPAHKVVLAACSPFFKALFKHQPHIATYTLRERGALIEQIIEYAYGRSMDGLTMWQVERLLPLADQWAIMDLVDACCNVMRAAINHQNVIGIWTFSKHFNLTKMADAAADYILYNMTDIALNGYSNEYLQLSAEHVELLLKDNMLNVQCEREVEEMVTRWVSVDAARQPLSNYLKSACVRGYDNKVYSAGYRRHQPVRPAVSDDKMDTSTSSSSAHSDSHNSSVSAQSNQSCEFDSEPEDDLPLACFRNTKPRIPRDVLFTIGGWHNGAPAACVEVYDQRARAWYQLDTNIQARAYHGLVQLNNKFYIVGGYDGSEYYNSVNKWDLETDIWEEVSPMYWARCYVCVCVYDGMIYAIGGFDGRMRLSCAEKYNPVTNQWHLINSMSRRRSDAACAVFKDCIFVVGGFDGQNVLSSAEMYNPVTDTWTMITQMNNPRSGVSCVAYNNSLIVLGGYDGLSRLSSVEKYDVETHVWRELADMHVQRSNFAACILENKLYVIGGFDGDATIEHVEYYDWHSDRWIGAPRMKLAKSALKCIVVPHIPNPHKFTYYAQDYNSL